MNRLDEIGIPRRLDVRQIGEGLFSLMEALGGHMSEEHRDDYWEMCTRTYQWFYPISKIVITMEVTYRGMDEKDFIWLSFLRDGQRFCTEKMHRALFNQSDLEYMLTRIETFLKRAGHSYELEFMEHMLDTYRQFTRESMEKERTIQ